MDNEDELPEGKRQAYRPYRSDGTISLAQLEAFVEVINKGGLKKAAFALKIDESTVRDRISNLEDWLGKLLFFKRPTYKLAPDGHDFRDTAEEIVSVLIKSRKELSMRDMAALTGTDLQAAGRKVINPVTEEFYYEVD